MNAEELLRLFTARLKNDSTQLDTQIILAHVLKQPRAWLLAHLDTHLTAPQIESATQAFEKFQAGTPLPYILGHWEFFGLEFEITEDVLIPRPETELLVEKAIAWLQASSTNHPEHTPSVADIGTGSGAIAISIATQVPEARILATDISPAALRVAKHNAEKFNVQHQIEFVECDLLPSSSFPPHPSSFDLICANPPYIPTHTLRLLPIFGREPTIALDGGADGLDAYRRLFEIAPSWLAPQGIMLLETEATLGVKALSLAYDSFSNVSIHLHQDLAGHDRLLEIQFHEQQF